MRNTNYTSLFKQDHSTSELFTRDLQVVALKRVSPFFFLSQSVCDSVMLRASSRANLPKGVGLTVADRHNCVSEAIFMNGHVGNCCVNLCSVNWLAVNCIVNGGKNRNCEWENYVGLTSSCSGVNVAAIIAFTHTHKPPHTLTGKRLSWSWTRYPSIIGWSQIHTLVKIESA